jgi:hypothetical protein
VVAIPAKEHYRGSNGREHLVVGLVGSQEDSPAVVAGLEYLRLEPTGMAGQEIGPVLLVPRQEDCMRPAPRPELKVEDQAGIVHDPIPKELWLDAPGKTAFFHGPAPFSGGGHRTGRKPLKILFRLKGPMGEGRVQADQVRLLFIPLRRGIQEPAPGRGMLNEQLQDIISSKQASDEAGSRG